MNYDYVCMPDDDIAASAGTWSAFFEHCHALKAKLAAPALTPDSYFTYPITMQNTAFRARSTTFVEVMVPCLSGAFLRETYDFLLLSRTGIGYGIDFLWPTLLSYQDIWIVDETPVCHTRPVSSARSELIQTLCMYDLQYIMDFGVIRSIHTMGGFARDGRYLAAGDVGFIDLYHQGYAYFNERHPAHWREILSLPAGPRPPVNPGAIARLRTAVFYKLGSAHSLSRGKRCLQSSTSRWSWSPDPEVEATGANDGLINGNCGFHTSFENDPWWQVDLGEVNQISSILIYNRLDQAARCNDLDILLSMDGRNWNCTRSKRDGVLFGGLDGKPLRIDLGPAAVARFVRVQAIGFTCLHLDQVEVFGRALLADALGEQSIDWSDHARLKSETAA